MRFTVLGVQIDNVTRQQAIALVEEAIKPPEGRAASVFFVNAHTLNLAASDPSYRQVLNRGRFRVCRRHGRSLGGPAPGFASWRTWWAPISPRHCWKAPPAAATRTSCWGADAQTIAVAADYARRTFPGWTQAGFHHGYLTDEAAQFGRHRHDQRGPPRRAPGGHGKPDPGAMDPAEPAAAERAGLHGHRRIVRLLGGQRQPRAEVAAEAGTRMALATLSTAEPESPPLPHRQPAVPGASSSRTMEVRIGGRINSMYSSRSA